MLRFVKGGNTFAIVGGHHLVNVSQGMLGVRWPQEEWKPNLVELKVSIVFDKRKCANQGRFLHSRWIFNMMLSAGCFYIVHGKEIPKTRTSFFQNTMNFGSGFNNFGNIFFTISGII